MLFCCAFFCFFCLFFRACIVHRFHFWLKTYPSSIRSNFLPFSLARRKAPHRAIQTHGTRGIAHNTHPPIIIIIMPGVGNLRTAANNDQDDDPRALRPIPIATKEMVSFVELLRNDHPGHTSEVVRFVSLRFVCFPQRLDLIIADYDESVCLLLPRARVLTFPSSCRERKREREREERALHRILVLRLLSLLLSERNISIVSRVI